MIIQDIQLKWENTLSTFIRQYSDKVRESILYDIEKEFLPENAEDLIFHHIPVTEKGYTGPLIEVWGVAGDTRWYCAYIDKPVWITSQEIDEINYIIPGWYCD